MPLGRKALAAILCQQDLRDVFELARMLGLRLQSRYVTRECDHVVSREFCDRLLHQDTGSPTPHSMLKFIKLTEDVRWGAPG